MAAAHWLSRYIADIDNIGADSATEISYRTPIDNMLQAAAKEFSERIEIVHEPKRTKNIGAPDFLISAKGGGVVGYVECKKPGADLQSKDIRAQVEKYRALSENIMLTDSLRWLHFRGGKKVAEVQLTPKTDKRKREEFAKVLQEFMITPAEEVADSKKLAQSLAKRCAILRDGLALHEKNKESYLHGLLNAFRKALDRTLDFPRFADFFSQTLIYSLLMAKLNPQHTGELTLENLRGRIPENFAVIRNIAAFLEELTDSEYEDIRWIIKDILAIINGMNEVAIAETMSYKRGISDNDDPYLNFYETFLAEYDPKLRESRGVYYTPPPVVKFIVRAADDLLRRDFNMPDGLAEEEKVIALDFAAGTGTFMLEMARLLFDGKSKGARDILAREHFLQNFHGFEMMASAYVISHLKLSRFLEDNDIKLKDNERIQIYLANTLEKIDKQIELSLMRSLEREAKAAQKVKDSPVLVIVGNPPYSGHSQNKGKWISDLLHGIDDSKKVGGSYYEVDGDKLDEKNTKWLQDDYVKFIRFAQRKMDMVERGVVAVITNHGFLDNPTFRGMRQSLMNTFNTMYFLDLRGNIADNYHTSGKGADENVFDIRQGVAVSLLVKNDKTKQKRVFHASWRGTREEKYAACMENNIGTVKWKKVAPASPNYFFIPLGKGGKDYYNFKYAVDDIFAVRNAGCTTARDRFTLGFDEKEIRQRVESFVSMPPEDARGFFELGKDTEWRVELAQKDLRESGLKDKNFCTYAYRPFDIRHTYYTGKSRGFHCRPRGDIMSHMLQKNIGLLASLQHGASSVLPVFAVAQIPDINCIADMSAMAHLFPLYCYEKEMDAITQCENFKPKFREWIDSRYGVKHKPEDILGCIYAILHSPDYRTRYAEFLRRGFPRIPFPENNDEFKRFAAIGNKLIVAHLLQKNCNGKYGKLCGDGTSHEVERVHYDEKGKRLYFNKDEYFAPLPPEVFNFQIDGYKPLDKYLKSRKRRKLSLAEITNIKKTANAIAFTIAKMREIDNPPKS